MTDPYQDDYSSLATSDQEAYRQRDGFGRTGVLDETKVAAAGLEIFRAIEGGHLLDFIPFLAGPMHPLVVAGRGAQDKKIHTIACGVHKKVGPNNDDVICMAKTYGQPCGRCAVREKLERDPNADEEVVKILQPARYPLNIYLIWDRKNETKGLQVWAISGWFMEKHLQSRSSQPIISSESLGAIGTGKIIYSHPGAGIEGGRHVSFTVKGKGMATEFLAHDFIVRKNPIPKEILQRAWTLPALDSFLVIPDYEELKTMSLIGAEDEPTRPAEIDRGAYEIPTVSPRMVGAPADVACPYGATIGVNFGEYEECRNCHERFTCEGMTGKGMEMAPVVDEVPWTEPTQQIFTPTPVQAPVNRPTPIQPIQTLGPKPTPQPQVSPTQIPPRPLRRQT
jgi:hypothetical protein